MGYAHYEISRNGQIIEAGYAVEAECETDSCVARIDRGLGHLCGETPGGTEHGCGGYFCGEHLYSALPGQIGYLCGPCWDAVAELAAAR
ncbi:hypothetical protein [Kitasatospora fiedleri]|uniref:hypothetical protein n=1 Tax=Kitasatospora fiedleri TaxID=2991545 RepID=UPI00249B5F0E|nr:hypothetical protein [Kitasatospora fiedleri]